MERESAPLSIVIPVLDEVTAIPDLITALERDGVLETIIVDGGSSDGTQEMLRHLQETNNFRLIVSDPGRARQMNVGAVSASGDILLFLHADTRLPANFVRLLAPVFVTERGWGRFDVRFDDTRPLMRIVAGLMNFRSRVTGIATGDQAIFVRAGLFDQVGGYADIPIMEDVELCRRLRQISSPFCVSEPAVTSARRWRQNGMVRTILLMWGLRLAFWLGVSPDRLARRYQHARQ